MQSSRLPEANGSFRRKSALETLSTFLCGRRVSSRFVGDVFFRTLSRPITRHPSTRRAVRTGSDVNKAEIPAFSAARTTLLA
jgi:hypothetical protein